MHAAYTPAAWSTFFSAEAGASAALTGLIFVAVSINLPRIVSSRHLVARAALALFTLMGVLLASTLALAPGQAPWALGWELAAAGALVWGAVTWAQQRTSRGNPYVGRWQRLFHLALTQLSSLPFVAGGVSLMIGRGGGLYWLVGGTIFSLIAALLDAWVLLVEILR